MRKKKILSLLLVGTQLAALMSAAIIPASAAVTYTDTMNIVKTATPPTIDGNLNDSTWELKELPKTSLSDVAKYDMKWDEKYLYVAVSVTGDDLILPGTRNAADPWGSGDGVRLFFDKTMHCGPLSAANGDLNFQPVLPKDGKDGDALLLYDNNMANVDNGIPDIMKSILNKNADYKCKIIDGNAWNIEMRIDWADLRITPAVAKEFGFNIQVKNKMNAGSSYHLWTTNNQDPKNGDFLWNNTSGYGKAILADLPASGYSMDAANVTTAPEINGDIAEWGNLSRTMADAPADKDYATFDMKYDDEFIYIATKVENHTGAVTETSIWNSGDIISVYFDPTMHRGTLSGSVYDLQIGFGYNSKGTPSIITTGKEGEGVADELKKIKAACSPITNGWILEAKIPRSALHINPPTFGFNIMAENNGAKVYANWAEGDGFYQSTAQYGKVTLKRPAATSLTSTTESLDIPLNTSMNLSDIKFVLDGNKNIDATFYDMKIAFSKDGIVAVENGKLVGKSAGSTDIIFSVDDKKVTIPVAVKAIALITIEPIGDQDAYVGVEKTLTVKATTTMPTDLTFAAEGLPAGATFNAETHTFKWTPTADQKGDLNITFTVSDKDSKKSETVKFTVSDTPAITVKPIENKTVVLGNPVAFIFEAKDSLGLELTATCSNLPTGAKFSSSKGNFFFTWIPTKSQLGTHDLKFDFTNGVNHTAANVKIIVTDKNAESITFTPVSNRTITAGEAIQYTVSASSSTGKPIKYTVIDMPSGATFDKDTHIVSWVTNSSDRGTYYFKIEATDGTNTAQQSVTILVNNKNNGNSHSSYGGGSGGYTGNAGSMGNKTNEVVQSSNRFKDMANHQWAIESVDFLADYGIINGVTKDNFAPGHNITRADFVLLLMRTFKFSGNTTANFSDVNNSDYFAKEIAAAKEIGLVTGSGANKFNPKAAITREDMMVMLNRALKLAGLVNIDVNEQVLANYNDVASISNYAVSSVSNLVSNNLIAGNNGNINPNANTTRAEVAVIIHRMFLKYGANLL